MGTELPADASPTTPTDARRRPPFRLGHRPELDGLRGVAVVLVVLFHTKAVWPDADGWLPRGGFLGVDLFLALSGFLITAVLLTERDRVGSIDLGAFLRRRGLRLVPAMSAILLVALAIAVTDRWYADGKIYVVDEVVATSAWSLTFMANWAVVFDRSLQPLGHIWTVGLEGQFYLFWGVALVVASRARRTLGVALVLALVTIAAVAWWRWVSYTNHPIDFWAHYVSTLTRLDAPLLGAVGAVWVVSGKAGRLDSAAWQLGGLVGIASLLLAAQYVQPFEPALFRGGFTLVAWAATVAVLGAVLARDGVIGRVLRVRPLVQAGLISYSLYLWHLPVFLLLLRQTPGWPQPARAAVGIVVSVALAWLSYRFVERPFLRRKAQEVVWPAEPARAAA